MKTLESILDAGPIADDKLRKLTLSDILADFRAKNSGGWGNKISYDRNILVMKMCSGDLTKTIEDNAGIFLPFTKHARIDDWTCDSDLHIKGGVNFPENIKSGIYCSIMSEKNLLLKDINIAVSSWQYVSLTGDTIHFDNVNIEGQDLNLTYNTNNPDIDLQGLNCDMRRLSVFIGEDTDCSKFHKFIYKHILNEDNTIKNSLDLDRVLRTKNRAKFKDYQFTCLNSKSDKGVWQVVIYPHRSESSILMPDGATYTTNGKQCAVLYHAK